MSTNKLELVRLNTVSDTDRLSEISKTPSAANGLSEAPFQTSTTIRGVKVMKQKGKTCLAQLTSGVFVHDWILKDSIDKKQISTALQPR